MSIRALTAVRALILATMVATPFAPRVSVAAADTCSMLDSSCVGSASGSNDPVGDVTGTIGSTANDAVGAAGDAAHGAGDQVGGAASQVRGQIDRVLGTGGTPAGGGDGRGGSGQGHRGSSGDRTSSGGRAPVGHPSPTLRVSRRSAGLASTRTIAPVDAFIGRPAAGFFSTSTGRVVAAIAHVLRFPVLLLVLVLGFMVVQQRLDRRSPKIAVARVDRDVVRFS